MITKLATCLMLCCMICLPCFAQVEVPKAPTVVEVPRVDDDVQVQKANQKTTVVEQLQVQKVTPVQSATQKAPTAVVVPTQKAVQAPVQKAYSVGYAEKELNRHKGRRANRHDRRLERRSYAGVGVSVGLGLCGRLGCH